MKSKIGVITQDRALWQKIRLLLRATHEVELLDGRFDRAEFSMILHDTDTRPEQIYEGEILLGRSYPASADTLPIPFRYDELILLTADGAEDRKTRLRLSEEDKICLVGDEKIKLTDVEFRLLKALLSADGYLTRDKLLLSVWDNETDRGVVNVYIHYLREKLETDGSRIILCSRKEGYKIDERYR